MHVIGIHVVAGAREKYPERADALAAWFHAVRDARWNSFDDIRGFDKHVRFQGDMCRFQVEKGFRMRCRIHLNDNTVQLIEASSA